MGLESVDNTLQSQRFSEFDRAALGNAVNSVDLPPPRSASRYGIRNYDHRQASNERGIGDVPKHLGCQITPAVQAVLFGGANRDAPLRILEAWL